MHQLSSVLSTPANLSTTATAAGLSSLAITLTTVSHYSLLPHRIGLSTVQVLPGLIQSLETVRGITVFAPVNTAFTDLVGLLSTIPSGTIDNVLAHREPYCPMFLIIAYTFF